MSLRVDMWGGALFVERQGNKFVLPTGQTVLTINDDRLFTHIQDGVKLRLTLRKRDVVAEFDSQIERAELRLKDSKEYLDYLKQQRIDALREMEDDHENQSGD